MDGANKASRQLEDLGRYIAWRARGDYIAGPLKEIKSLMPKLLFNYHGNVGDLKDVVRCTVVGDSVAVVDYIQNTIKSHCTPENNYPNIIKFVDIDPSQDDCGYSGANVVVTLPCKRPGEIQVNIPAVMFGKFTKDEYMAMLHTNKAQYETLVRKFRLEGGLGHALYKLFGENKGNATGLDAAALSKRYYAYFRGFPNPPETYGTLQADLDKFKSANKEAFKH